MEYYLLKTVAAFLRSEISIQSTLIYVVLVYQAFVRKGSRVYKLIFSSFSLSVFISKQFSLFYVYQSVFNIWFMRAKLATFETICGWIYGLLMFYLSKILVTIVMTDVEIHSLAGEIHLIFTFRWTSSKKCLISCNTV